MLLWHLFNYLIFSILCFYYFTIGHTYPIETAILS
jgi:hypothetical protein